MKTPSTDFFYLFILGIFTIFPCEAASDGKLKWYKGNTHTHTTRCNHADTSPEDVTKWYHDHGYHFLVLSEHNVFIDPKKVAMPANARKDFILIPGEEITGQKHIHTTAMNIEKFIPFQYKNRYNHQHEIIQSHVHETQKAGGHAILNHPNFQNALGAKDILPVEGLYLFELYNAHPSVKNFGGQGQVSTEDLWDSLLTAGKTVYGVSSDDAHTFKKLSKKDSNPGRGWVMVQSASLTPDSITHAMTHGQFYSSNGVILKDVSHDLKSYSILIDEKATLKQLEAKNLHGHIIPKKNVVPGFQIEFIGLSGGSLKLEKNKTETRFPIVDQVYVRSKITYTRILENGSGEAFYAWTQPQFCDQRKNDH